MWAKCNFEVSTCTVLMLAIQCSTRLYRYCVRMWFAVTTILDSVWSWVPIIEPFSEQSLIASRSEASQDHAVPIACSPLLPEAYIIKRLKLYRRVPWLTLSIVSLHSSWNCKRASWNNLACLCSTLVGIANHYPQHSSAHAYYLWYFCDVWHMMSPPWPSRFSHAALKAGSGLGMWLISPMLWL